MIDDQNVTMQEKHNEELNVSGRAQPIADQAIQEQKDVAAVVINALVLFAPSFVLICCRKSPISLRWMRRFATLEMKALSLWPMACA